MSSCSNLTSRARYYLTRARAGTLAAILAAYVAGTMAPHAAADATHDIVSELRGIRTELTAIRRRLEGAAR